jgi:hypothetical protein
VDQRRACAGNTISATKIIKTQLVS